MTPRSMADYLLIKFKLSESRDGYNDVRDYHAANRCALIAAEEIIKIIKTLDDSYWHSDTLEFWEQVKKEIEKT